MATKNLAGRQFGRWSVIERANESGAARWKCRCRCGTERVVAAKNLIAGVSTSCGCYTKERVRESLSVDYTGQRFGKLLVLERAEAGKNGAARWKCRCDCGKECEALQSALQNGRRADCGCESKRGNTAKDVAGQRFGNIVAVEPTPGRKNGYTMWRCGCSRRRCCPPEPSDSRRGRNTKTS